VSSVRTFDTGYSNSREEVLLNI